MELITFSEAAGLGLGLTALSGLAGCGPSRLQIEPADVAAVTVRPASRQPLFCPGDRLQIELVTKMKDGTRCSNINKNTGCLGKSDAVIAPEVVRLQATPARALGEFIVRPDPDPLKTASTGLLLRGWIEKNTDGMTTKSMVDEVLLKPVYGCMRENVFTVPQRGEQGQHGTPAPNLTVAITPLSTPYYPNAALIRVDDGARRTYLISAAADQPVHIIAKGQDGAPGEEGEDGDDGDDGHDDETKVKCATGGAGQDGADGGPGGTGGDGGRGGTIRIVLDDAAADKLRGRIRAASVGGAAGPGGEGGSGGRGGKGGEGGPVSSECTDTRGQEGREGRDGHRGHAGRLGADGEPPTFSTAPRATLFASELEIIRKIEAAPAKK